MKNWLLFFLFLTLQLQAEDPLYRTIESISYRSQQGNTIALIKLSDDSVWKWIPDTYSENLLRKWAYGDPVVIKTTNHPGFILHNLTHPVYSPTVSLTFNSYLLFPSLEQFDLENRLLTLSDGTEWEILFDFNKRTLHHWATGDRIIPVEGEHGNFELINLDIPHQNRAQIERNIQVGPLAPPEEMYARAKKNPPLAALGNKETLEPKEADLL